MEKLKDVECTKKGEYSISVNDDIRKWWVNWNKAMEKAKKQKLRMSDLNKL